MSQRLSLPLNGLEQATARQLFELMKLLGIEQNVIAQQLGISHTPVSLWARGHRPIPAKYRPRLLEWARVAWEQAEQRNMKEALALPTPDRQVAAIEAFMAPIRRWQIEMLYEAGEVQASARKNARWLLELLEHETYTPSDLEQMRGLYLVLGNKLDILEEMAGPKDESAAPEQEGDVEHE
jgi:transcriptional regulator with XRE-family HTH domain